MSFQILPNDKFGVVVLVRSSKADFRAPLDLGRGLWVLDRAPFDVGQIWRKWIGSIAADRIADANLWFVAARPSKTPEVYDQENKELKDQVWHLFLGLLVVGSPYYEGGYILTGAHVDGTPNVREYSEIKQYHASYGAQSLRVDQPEIQSALQIRAGLRAVYASQGRKRLQRGVGVLFKGLQEDFAFARLHQFTRSVEAVVKPTSPGIKKKVVDRCRTFLGVSTAAKTIIGECYELRSKEEHVLDWQDALLHYASAQREAVLFQRVRQIEGLCRHVYQRVLASAHHMTDFEDSAIDGFWRRPEPDRAARWGSQLRGRA